MSGAEETPPPLAAVSVSASSSSLASVPAIQLQPAAPPDPAAPPPPGAAALAAGGLGDLGVGTASMEDRMSALHDLFRQKQQDLLLYYQQAQQDLVQQHVRYSQQLSQAFDAERRRQELAAEAEAHRAAAQAAAASLAALREAGPLRTAASSLINLHSPNSLLRPQHAGHRLVPGSELNIPGASGSATTTADQMLRRTVSTGSGAISNNTRERLVNLLKSKAREKELGGGGADRRGGSFSGMRSGPYPIPPVSMRNSSVHLPTTTTVQAIARPRPPQLAALGDYDLRKVSSEPNLMRQKLKDMLKSRRTPPPIGSSASAFKSPTGMAPRNASSSTTNLLGSGTRVGIAECSATPALPLPSQNGPPKLVAPSPQHPVFLSPSLPNIPSLGPLEIASLLASQANQGAGPNAALSAAVVNHLSQFLSMPSLFQGLNPLNVNPPPMGITLPLSGAGNVNTLSSSATDIGDAAELKHAAALDQTGLRISGLAGPAGSSKLATSVQPSSTHPNLLKQQIRDLVLRRKSLVREETEEDLGQRLPSVSEEPQSSQGTSATPPATGRTGLAYDAAMSKHQCMCGANSEHVEHGGRIHSIWARLQAKGLVEACERITARKAPIEALKLAHSDTYVTFFAISPTACLKLVESCRDPSQLPLTNFVRLGCGGYGVDSDTYFNDASTQIAARLAAGHVSELALAVAEGRVLNGFAVVRPPGHHAERDQAMGFCYFNNVAVAAKVLQQRATSAGKAPPRIAIVDWDVHHGNGTQMAFDADPSVLYLSLHRHDNGNFFPGTGAVTDIGTEDGRHLSVNVSWSGGTMGDADYLAAWRSVVEPVLGQFGPDLVLVSCGFDAAAGHSPALGGYQLSPAIFAFMTRRLMRFAGGKVVLALEGGYDLAAISDAAELCVRSLLSPSRSAGGKVVLALEGGYDLAAISDAAELCVRSLLSPSRSAGGKVVLALEGGYDLAAISDAAELCVRSLLSPSRSAGGKVVLALEGGYDLAAISDAAELCVRSLLSPSRSAGGKVVLALEGGYDLAAISDAAELCVRSLLSPSRQGEIGDPKEWLSSECLAALPQTAARETLQKVIAVQKNFWRGLEAEAVSVSENDWAAVLKTRGAGPSSSTASPTTVLTPPLVIHTSS